MQWLASMSSMVRLPMTLLPKVKPPPYPQNSLRCREENVRLRGHPTYI